MSQPRPDDRFVVLDGPKIRRLRKGRGWTQDTLSENAGLSKRAIESVEACQRVALETVRKIAEALKVEPKVLIRQDGFRPPEIDEPSIPGVESGNAPAPPAMVVGRDDVIKDLKTRLTATRDDGGQLQVLTTVRGWPGIGKTTVAAKLAHDASLLDAFPHGILWASLGQHPDLLPRLASWGRPFGIEESLLRAKSVEEAKGLLAGVLRNKRALLIVDDVWKPEHAAAFAVGGSHCATLVTTRVTEVAHAITPSAQDIYILRGLDEVAGVALLQVLAPQVAADHPKACIDLVIALDGLPLALQVAGRMLLARSHAGWGVRELLKELRSDSEKLLSASVPPDMADLVHQTTPTIAAALLKSIEVLDPVTRERYAFLGVFGSKPSNFDLGVMAAVWKVEDARPTAEILISRGLLEPVPGSKRYQMHALFVFLAHSMLKTPIVS